MQQAEEYAVRTLRSGITPIVLKFQPVYDCYNGEEIAYIGKPLINSLVYGVLTPELYARAADMAQEGCDFTLCILRKTMRLLKELDRQERLPGKLLWLTVPAPSALLLPEDLYDTLKSLMAKENFDLPGKICLMFGADVFSLGSDIGGRGFSDIRAAGMRVAVNGYGDADFPVTRMLEMTPDVAMMTPDVIPLFGDRSRPRVGGLLVRLAGSMNVRVVAQGVRNDAQLRELNAAECLGFLPAEDYHGEFTCSSRLLDPEEILRTPEVS